MPAHGINIDVQVSNKTSAKATREKPTHKMSYKYIVVGGGVVRAVCWQRHQLLLRCDTSLPHHLAALPYPPACPLTHPSTSPPP